MILLLGQMQETLYLICKCCSSI